MNNSNPHNLNEDQVRSKGKDNDVVRATVTDVLVDTHSVRVNPRGNNAPTVAPVLSLPYGSTTLPQAGERVILLYVAENTPVCLGSVYLLDGERPPDVDEGTIYFGNGEGYIGIDDEGNIVSSGSLGGSSYGDENAQDAVGGILSDDFTYDDGANVIDLAFNAVTQTTFNNHTGDADAHHSKTDAGDILSVVGDSNRDVNIGVDDKRDASQPPTNFGREISFDFKRTSTLSLPSSGTYSGVMTFAPWNDNSGDKSHQLGFGNDGLYYRNEFPESSSWGDWTRVGNEQKIFLAEDTNNNINSSTTVSWNNTTFNDSPYSWDGSQNVTIDKAGRYEIHAEADFQSGGGTRKNPNLFIEQNSNIVGVKGRSGYMRDVEGHDHSSVHAHAIVSANSGDTINVQSKKEADSGTVTAERSLFYIKRVPKDETESATSGYFDSHLTSTQTNAENGFYVNVAESVNENDGWTVNNASEISPDRSGKYKIDFSVNFHRRTGDGGRNIMYAEIEKNGTRLDQRSRGVCYIRNYGSGDEGDAKNSVILDCNSGDTIRIYANQERGYESGNDIERANITIQQIQ